MSRVSCKPVGSVRVTSCDLVGAVSLWSSSQLDLENQTFLPGRCLGNSSNVDLIDDGHFSSFSRRLSNIPFSISLLQTIHGVIIMSVVRCCSLCPHNKPSLGRLKGEESTHKGVNQRSKYVPQVQQRRPESPTVTLTWNACKYKVRKLHQRYIFIFG